MSMFQASYIGLEDYSFTFHLARQVGRTTVWLKAENLELDGENVLLNVKGYGNSKMFPLDN